MTTAATTFPTPFLSDKELRTLSPQLYDFSEWLMQNRSTYTDTELKAEVAKVTESITTDKLQKLWNNLYYQMVTQKDFYVKEAVMQMLIAYQVKTKFSTTDTEVNKNLVNARLALPVELFLDDEAADPVVAEPTGTLTPTLPTAARQQALNAIAAEVANANAATLKKQVGKLEKAYRKGYQEAYDTAYAQYQTTIAPTLAQYQADLEAKRKSFCGVRNSSLPYDEKDPCQQPDLVPYPSLPEFRFTYDAEIDTAALEAKLPYADKITLMQVLGYDFAAKDGPAGQATAGLKNVTLPLTYEEINREIDGFIEKNNQAIISNTIVTLPQVIIGGVVIPLAGTETSLNQDNFIISPAKSGRTTVYNLELGTQDQNIVKIAVTQKNRDNTTSVTTIEAPGVLRAGGTRKVDRLFTYTSPDGVAASAPTFDFDISLSDGSVKKLPGVNATQVSSQRGKLTTVTAAPVVASNATPVKSFSIPRFGLKQVGIADYLKVEQSVQCYVEGEVSHIENIMAREYKEKSSRRLTRTEDTITSSSETENEKLTDTTSTDRFEMQTEVNKVIQETKDKSVSASVGYQNAGFTVNTGAGLASNTSKEDSIRMARTEAQEITARAQDRVVSKVKEERIRKVIEEFEESNKHGFDNRKGDKHVVGVYRWVDKLYKNQIVNYGKRLMYEFMVPEPARLHLLGMAPEPAAPAAPSTITAPADPRTVVGSMKMASPADVNDLRLAYWAGIYNVELEKKPEEFMAVGDSFSINVNGAAKLANVEANSGAGKVTIPENYKAVSAYGIFNAVSDGNGSGGKLLSLNIGNVTRRHNQTFGDYTIIASGTLTSNYGSEVPVSYTLGNHVAGDIAVSISCQLTTEALNAWKQNCFKAIITKYEEALAEYNKKISEQVVVAQEKKLTNPGFYREIEKTILKKNCISYVVDKVTANTTNTYGRLMHNNSTSFTEYEVNPNQTFNNYSGFVKFMEQAFEWDIISYNFYPFYWAHKDTWKEKYQFDESADPVFRSFIQSGMARVMVTVRPGFEEAVLHFMNTGAIWNGGHVPSLGDKLYMSITDELKQPAGEKQGKAWLTRVPTSLTILQAGSAGLIVEKALPCDCEGAADFENPQLIPCSENFELNANLVGGDETETQPATT